MAISLIRLSSAKENSTPKANRRKATPTSAKDLIKLTSFNNLKPKGPTISPLAKYPSKTG